MKSLEKSLLHTILYFDLFNFAPTLSEIERWLIGHKPTSLSELQRMLESHPQIAHKEGFYFLRGREAFVELRKQKYRWTDEKWKHAKPFLRLLAWMPGVEAIWFANSVGWCNASQQSDTDLIIVASPRRIWTARFFTTTVMKLFRQRPGEQEHAKALCLSFYITADHLNVAPYRIGPHDIHFTFWATQMYPLYDPQHLFTQYQQKNTWVTDTFAGNPWLAPIPQRRIRLSYLEQALKRLLTWLPGERIWKWIQLRILPPHLKTLAQSPDHRVVISDQLLKFHDNDNRVEKQEEWERRKTMLHYNHA